MRRGSFLKKRVMKKKKLDTFASFKVMTIQFKLNQRKIEEGNVKFLYHFLMDITTFSLLLTSAEGPNTVELPFN